LVQASFFKQASSWLFGYESVRSFREIECAPKATIIVENINGPITIQGWSLPAIASEVVIERPREILADVSITYGSSDNTVRIQTCSKQHDMVIEVSHHLMVPRQAKLIVKTQSGSITIKQCFGSISAVASAGNVVLQEVHGPLFVHAHDSIEAHIHAMIRDSYELVSQQGSIVLTLPSMSDVSVVAQAVSGYVFSEHKMSLLPYTMKLNNESWRWARRNVRGTLGIGGPLITLQAYGDIYLKEKL
jgi:hypothetical protein